MKQNQPGIRRREKPITKVMNKIVLKNLAICLGISLALGSVNSPVSELFHEQVEATTQFQDDASIRDYSREAVESLVSLGSIKGYPDNTFKPAGTITRIEYYSMAANAFDKDGSKRAKIIQDKKNLVDGGINVYAAERKLYADDIAEVWGGKAEDLILTSGDIQAGMFESDALRVNGRSAWLEPITRAEAAQMLVACMENFGGEKLEIKDNIQSKIGDYNDSHSDSKLSANPVYDAVAACSQKNAILKLYSAGIVEGSNDRGDYFPQYNLTREQAAQTIYRAVNKNKRSTVNVAPIPEKEQRAATTIDLTDPNRITALPGDTVKDASGKTYTVGEIAGVPYIKGMALDLGRNQLIAGDTVKNGTDNDGSLGDEVKLFDTYVVSPNGTGLWESQWETLIKYYESQIAMKPGKNGDIISVGDDNWSFYMCKDYIAYLVLRISPSVALRAPAPPLHRKELSVYFVYKIHLDAQSAAFAKQKC